VVAARVFGVPEAEVTKDMRRQAKVINFGIIYGMGVNALRTNLGGTRQEAQEFHDNYFKTFPKIKAYFDGVKERVAELGYSETYFGRRRYFPLIKSRLPFMRATAERMAMNAPLQGTGADIVKIAMRLAAEEINQHGWEEEVFLLLQVHDELIYEVKTALVPQVVLVIKAAMERAFPGEVPLEVSYKVGQCWGELK
jgi:DNA polymerase-1